MTSGPTWGSGTRAERRVRSCTPRRYDARHELQPEPCTHPAPEAPGGTSEMNTPFLRAGAMLAGAAVIASTMTIHPATATNALRSITSNATKKCNSASPCTAATNSGSGAGLAGSNTGVGDGVDGNSNNNNGLGGVTYNPSKTNGGRSGVYGIDASSDGGFANVGITGQSTTGTGVRGVSVNNYGVTGLSQSGTGVVGSSGSGIGVVGQSNSNLGIEGVSLSGLPAIQAVSTTHSAAMLAYGGTSNDFGGYSLEA